MIAIMHFSCSASASTLLRFVAWRSSSPVSHRLKSRCESF